MSPTMTKSTTPARSARPRPNEAASPPRKATHVVLTWAGGRTRFEIDVAAWLLTETAANRLREVLGRLTVGAWGVGDVVNTIAAGLKGPTAAGAGLYDREALATAVRAGNGVGENEVERLVARHVRAHPLGESVELAQAILIAAIYGLPREVADAGMTPAKLVAAVLGNSVEKSGVEP